VEIRDCVECSAAHLLTSLSFDVLTPALHITALICNINSILCKQQYVRESLKPCIRSTFLGTLGPASGPCACSMLEIVLIQLVCKAKAISVVGCLPRSCPSLLQTSLGSGRHAS
jgi:hypothetical protein